MKKKTKKAKRVPIHKLIRVRLNIKAGQVSEIEKPIYPAGFQTTAYDDRALSIAFDTTTVDLIKGATRKQLETAGKALTQGY